MIKSIKRKILKNKKSSKQRRDCVDLDSVAASLEFQKDLGMVFDPRKKEEKSRILNYFFIVGPAKKNKTLNEQEDEKENDCEFEPALLFTYPSHKFPFSHSDFNHVIQFCYPEGFEKLNSNIYKKNTSSRFTKTKNKKKGNREKFVFGLNDGGTLYFCVVTRFYASLFNTLPTSEYPMCLVSVTSSSLLTTHFTFHKFLYFIIVNHHISDNWETYLRANSIMLKTKKKKAKKEENSSSDSDVSEDSESDSNPISPFIKDQKNGDTDNENDPIIDLDDDTIQLLDTHLLRDEFESDSSRLTTLTEFYDTNFSMHLLDSNPLFSIRENYELEYKFVEKADRNFLRVIEFLFCFQVLEDRYQRISLHLYGEEDEIILTIEIPKLSDQLLEVGRFSFKSLLRCLSIKDVVRYYRAALLEQQILLISNDVSTLTRCALATLVMVAPMSPKCAILPVLPDDPNFLDYLGTPTPFVFGALDTELSRNYLNQISPSITIIDLTNGDVIYPDDVFHVPHIDILKTKLRDIMRGVYKKPQSTFELFNGRQQPIQSIQSPPPPIPKPSPQTCAPDSSKKKHKLKANGAVSESAEQVNNLKLAGDDSSLYNNDTASSSSNIPMRSAKYCSDLSSSNLPVKNMPHSYSNSSLSSVNNTNNLSEGSNNIADSISPLFILFNEYFVSQERLTGCRVRDTTDEDHPVVGFVKDAYMVNVADNEIDFYDALVETQTFQAYCEETYSAPV